MWSGHVGPRARRVHVQCGGGLAWLACEDARLIPLPASEVLALPPLLQAIMAKMPHVVGLSRYEDEPMWLVDLRLLMTW